MCTLRGGRGLDISKVGLVFIAVVLQVSPNPPTEGRDGDGEDTKDQHKFCMAQFI